MLLSEELHFLIDEKSPVTEVDTEDFTEVRAPPTNIHTHIVPSLNLLYI